MACLFISYSSRDRAAAEAMHEALAAAGHDVWRDQTRLETDWSREIAMALSEADAVCLLWTANSAESRWVRNEWVTARALEKDILVCLFPDAPPLPEALGNLHGIPFESDATAELLRRLHQRPEEGTFRVRYDYRVLPPNSYIPFNPNPSFTGRHRDLLELYLKMIGNLNKIGLNQMGVVGMGGIGKTQLAVEFACRFSFGFDGVFWIQAADSEQWLRQFVELARDRLGLKIADPLSATANRQYLFALQDYCRQHPQLLIILDNVTDPNLLNSDRPFFGAGFAPLNLGCNLLFTSRKRFTLPGVGCQAVDVLEPEAAYELLTGERRPTTAAEEEDARGICNTVGYLPLAIVLATGYLNKYPEVLFGDYREELLKSRLGTIDIGEITAEQLATRHEAAMSVTLQTQWQAIGSDDARRLFTLGGQFPESAIIPKARLALLSGIGPGKSKLDRRLDRACFELIQLCLAEELGGAQAIRLHPLVRDFSSRLIAEPERAGFLANAAGLVKTAYDDPLRLQTECYARGAGEVIEDLSVAVGWTGGGSGAAGLEVLRQLLERQRHHLKADRCGGLPVSVLQQLHHCAVCMGRDERALADAVISESRSAGVPVLMTSGVYPLEDPAAIRVLQGHRRAVQCVALTADGRRAVSGSVDGAIIVWDVESGNALATLEGHSADVNAVCLTADANYLLSASSDHDLILWDLRAGRPLRFLKGHSKSVTSASLSPVGHRALSGSDDNTIKLWDLEKGEAVRSLRDDSPNPYQNISTEYCRRMLAVSMSSDGRRGLSVTWDRHLILWDLETGESLSLYSGITPCLGFSPDGRYAIGGWGDDGLLFWKVETGGFVEAGRFAGRSRGVAAAFSQDGSLLLSASDDQTLTLWDVATQRGLRRFWGHAGAVTGVALSADRSRAVSSSGDETLMVWDLRSTSPPNEYAAPSGELYQAEICKSGTVALTAGLYHIDVWDTQSGRPVKKLVHPTKERMEVLQGIGLSADGRRGFSSTHRSMIVWDLETGEPLRRLDMDMEDEYPVDAISLSSDARRVLVGYHAMQAYSDRSATLWDLDTGEAVLKHTRKTSGWVPRRALDMGSGLMVEATKGEKFVVANVRTGEEVCRFGGPAWESGLVCLSSDGRRALIEAEDHSLAWVDTGQDRVLATLRGHEARVTALALAEDGLHALSGSYDKTLVLWDLETGKALSRLCIKSYVMALGMAGDRVVVAESGGCVYMIKIVGLAAA